MLLLVVLVVVLAVLLIIAVLFSNESGAGGPRKIHVLLSVVVDDYSEDESVLAFIKKK